MKRVKSFAKINLGLEILGKRKDHFHEINTLFQAIELHDVMEFQLLPDNQILLSGSDETISWAKDNLIFRAVSILKEQIGVSAGIKIHVKKNIPAGKGLGGGSSNAAITLHTLNQIWDLQVDKLELMKLGSLLGADVPYFLEGGLCRGTGRGDKIHTLKDLPLCHCLLIFPDFPISTAAVYANFHSSLTSTKKGSKISRFLKSYEFRELGNELEETVFNLHPQIKANKSLMYSLGAELSLVSGSGSAVFGLFPEKEKAIEAFANIEGRVRVSLVETLSREHYVQGIQFGV